MDALTRALADAEQIRAAAKAGVSANPAEMLATGVNSVPWATNSVGRHAEQLAHFRGHQATAISAIARRIAGQALLVARDTPGRASKAQPDSLQPLDSHPLLAAVDTPNPLMVRWSLLFTTVASLELTGKAYWWLSRSRRSAAPQIWPLPASWVSQGDLLHSYWRIRPYNVGISEFIVDGAELAHFSLPDPANPFDAFSPLASQANAINADEAIERSQARAFENGIFPGLAVIAGDVVDRDGGEAGGRPLLDSDQKTIIEQALRRMFQGPGRAGSAIILDALIRDIKVLSNKPAEMDFLNSGAQTKSRIFEAFGVNPLLVGSVQGANYAQAWVAEANFIENVIRPLLTLMSQVITRWVCPAFSAPGERLCAWFEEPRADDPELFQKDWQYAMQFGVATPNEYRQRVLGLPPIGGGDVPLIPINMVRDEQT